MEVMKMRLRLATLGLSILLLAAASGSYLFAGGEGEKLEGSEGLAVVDEEGVVVIGVAEDSPAEKAGIERGDILLEIDGKEVEAIGDVTEVLEAHKAGDSITLKIKHGDDVRSVDVELEERLLRAPLGLLLQPSFLGFPSMGFNFMGPRFGEFPDLDLDELRWGALVSRLAEDSPAAAAGLEEGDIILAVGDVELTEDNSLADAVSEHNPGQEVTLKVLREFTETIDLPVELAENEEGDAYLGVYYRSFPWRITVQRDDDGGRFFWWGPGMGRRFERRVPAEPEPKDSTDI
jgi:S1-C subfamily serine protease